MKKTTKPEPGWWWMRSSRNAGWAPCLIEIKDGYRVPKQDNDEIARLGESSAYVAAIKRGEAEPIKIPSITMDVFFGIKLFVARPITKGMVFYGPIPMPPPDEWRERAAEDKPDLNRGRRR